MQGKIFFTLILSLMLASVAARLVSWAYRRRLVKLMSADGAPKDTAKNSSVSWPSDDVRSFSSGDRNISIRSNRAARLRLAIVLVVLSLFIGMSVAWFNLSFVYSEGGFGPIKLAILGAIYAAPIVPVLGMLWRWPWQRIAGVACLYVWAAVIVVWLWSSGEQSLIGVIFWLAGQVGLPLVAILILTGSGQTRAAAPYLFPPLFVLTTSSILGLDALQGAMSSGFSGIVSTLAELFGALLTFVLFAVVPWFVAYWPIRALARWLARSYRDKLFSEATYLFAGYWLVSLLTYALPPFGTIGWASFALLGPWLWIPFGLAVARPLLVRQEHAPILLVLRVFRRDAEVEALFDRIVEGWRYSGSVVLIAGSDLASRTMDPDDLFAYIQGSIANRFIEDQVALRKQLENLDTRADIDGLFRVNDFYCFDSTWQAVLLALVARSDHVLMDLRGFTAENRGCLFELETLARAQHLGKIVLLTDGKTDRDAARAGLRESAESNRIVWQDAGKVDSSKAQKILRDLIEPCSAN
jgi:hypothetical protein